MPRGWRPNVISFSLNLLEDLRPRAMTRELQLELELTLHAAADDAKVVGAQRLGGEEPLVPR